MEKLIFDITVHPTHELIAKCSCCGKELKREYWESYFSYSLVKRRIERTVSTCKYCGAVFVEKKKVPKWESTGKRFEEIAKAKNGDFLIWRSGGPFWKWRYRTYGAVYADQIGRVRGKAAAKTACEKHKEWRI